MKFYFSLICFLLCFNFGFAQDSSKTCGNELKYGVQFQVKSLLELTNFNGYTIAFRYRINNTLGLRIGLNTNITQDDYNVTQQSDSIINKPTNNSNNYDLKLSVQCLYSIKSYKNFNLIFGGGTFVSYSKKESNSENISSDQISKYDEKLEGIGYGLDLILGAEYELFDNVILSGEYGITFLKEKYDYYVVNDYRNFDGTSVRFRKDNGDRDRFTIKALGVNLGIAVFF